MSNNNSSSNSGSHLQNSIFSSSNIIFIEELYQKFLQDRQSVDANWQNFFQENQDEIKLIIADYQGPTWAKRNFKIIDGEPFDISSCSKVEIKKEQSPKKDSSKASGEDKATNIKNHDLLLLKIKNLIDNYRKFGHLSANLDPLGLRKTTDSNEISLSYNKINDEDLNCEISLTDEISFSKTTIKDSIAKLNQLYKSTIGAEFSYLANSQQRDWLTKNYEITINKTINKDEKIKILKEIIRTEFFEQFLHKRFPGAKRFSIEGGDSAINSIEKIIDSSAKSGVKKIVIGMAHRGRLNTLTGVMGKPYHQMIAEFKGTPGIPKSITNSGDVKYHMGYSNSRDIAGNKIDISLAFNPSHLEAVNPVVAGRIRAKQDIYQDQNRSQALALLIHGDAAFAGQGSVAESLMMNGIKGYDTGGVLHIIVNNQIGFTANPNDSRSTNYASDIAKSIDAPIFHINGDDVESVVKISDLIVKYRQEFKKDAVIDLICYRRYGHNEGDEPLYTQPIMYNKIKSHPSLAKIYSQKLIDENIISTQQYQSMVADFEKILNQEFELAEKYQPKEGDWLKKDWQHIKHNKNGDIEKVKTAVNEKLLKELANKINNLPSNFNINSKISKQFEARKESILNGKNIDWGNAESLAFASLINEGYPVRITGQDSGRGTFSHRHSVLHDQVNGGRYSVFSSLENKAKYEVHDSILSEYAVLGFEYGYSLSMPNGLTIWEAQFGDFANGAQIIFDQFIASSEVKWLRKSNLVMLLPHGYEGQGPEHSSARLERYLQACADNNIRVCNITSPANFFHSLRYQIHSKDRKPLVVMSPKSLLRHKLAISSLDEFSNNDFRTIIGDCSKINDNKKVKRVILCSGKVYYDLFEAREQNNNASEVAIIRLEQLYPFDHNSLEFELKKYPNADIIWCQEEPKNMGSWHFIQEPIENLLVKINHKNNRPKYVGRIASASPATGYGSYHNNEQKQLIEEALKIN